MNIQYKSHMCVCVYKSLLVRVLVLLPWAGSEACFVVCKLIFLWLTPPEAQPRRGHAGSSQYCPEDIAQRVHFNEARQTVVIASDSSYRSAKFNEVIKTLRIRYNCQLPVLTKWIFSKIISMEALRNSAILSIKFHFVIKYFVHFACGTRFDAYFYACVCCNKFQFKSYHAYDMSYMQNSSNSSSSTSPSKA